MADFSYQAIDKKTGKITKGIIQADSGQQARSLLRAQKLLTTSLAPVAQSALSTNASSWFAGKISTQKLMLFTRQLATMLSSGMEVDAALKLIANQADNKELSQVSSEIRGFLAEGMTLAQSHDQMQTQLPQQLLGNHSGR